MHKMHLRQQNLDTLLVYHLLKTKEEYKNLKKQKIQDIFIKMNYIKSAFNMISLMRILKIYSQRNRNFFENQQLA